MVYEIGKVPYTDVSSKASDRAIRHRSVYVKTLGGTYVVQVEGYSVGELPEPKKSFDEAISGAKRFIRRNRGSAFKSVALAGVCHQPGRRMINSAPNPAAVRRSGRPPQQQPH